MRRIRPISHEDRLSVVDHLDELRSRIIVSLAAVLVAFGLTMWQNHLVLKVLNRPLPHHLHPITFGVTEPFAQTLTNAGYAALLLALPVVLYEIYAFVLPAFSPGERRTAVPLMLLVPVLFLAGAAFCYFVVLPPAVRFLLHFNHSEFNTQVRAKDYYSFVMMTMLAVGIAFQVPVGILALVRMRITSVEALRRNRRYAILVIAVVAALLPTVDPVSLVLEMVPMIALYELSIILAATLGKPREMGDSVAPAEGS
jgi:sec-independent protein translocase protein TatC